jgi:bilin biosynthesis protein
MPLFGPPNVDKMRDRGDIKGLIQALNHPKMGQAAMAALVQIGDQGAVEPLIMALNDELSETRMEAAAALGNIGDPRAVQPLCRALSDDVGFVREQVIEALDKPGYFRAEQPPLAALRSRHEDVRAAAARLTPKRPSPS